MTPASHHVEVYFMVRISSPDESFVYESEIPLRYETGGVQTCDGKMEVSMQLTPVSQRKLEAVQAFVEALGLKEV